MRLRFSFQGAPRFTSFAVAAAVALLLGGGAGPLGAQVAEPPLTLGDLYRRLETASPRLSAAQAEARAAEARIPSARRPPDPQLQLGLMNRSLPGLGLSDPLGMNQIQVMQMVPFPGKLGAAGHVAAAKAGASTARAEDLRWELRSQAAMAFYDLYGADRAIEVATRSRELLRGVATTTQTMYTVGDGRQADVLRAQVEVTRMTEEIVRMGAMREVMAARLNALLDQGPDTPVGLPDRPRFPDNLPSLDSLVALALGGRPMLQAGKREVKAADATRALARREIWPDLQLGAIYGQRPMSGGGTDRMVSFMLGFSVPIFAGSRQLAMRREAEAMQDAARADLAAMEADTRGRVGVVYAELKRSRELSRLYRTDLVPQAHSTVVSSLAAYRVGDVNLMTLLDAQMAVNRYEQELFQLEAAEGKAWAELEMLIGATLIDPDRIADSERASS